MTSLAALNDNATAAFATVSGPTRHATSLLRHFDADAVSAAARAETRNREVHLPPISIYRWWARRTAAVNGALIDAFAVDRPNTRLSIADPFAGGGVIPLAAAIRGHRVYAQDLNPWAAVGLASMLALPQPDALREAAAYLHQHIVAEVQACYGTTMSDGEPGLISQTFRVLRSACSACGRQTRTFPHALVSLLTRRDRGGKEAFVACREGHLYRGPAYEHSQCPECDRQTDPQDVYTPGRTATCSCGHAERLEHRTGGASWTWEVVLVERSRPGKRELDLPTTAELSGADDERFVPARNLGPIPIGRETEVLRRHGFATWDDLYPRRQRVMIERLLELAETCSDDPAVVSAVRMAILGSVEMAGHLSRWDRFYLKSFESMAGHRFNFTTVAVEPNVWGAEMTGRGTTQRRLSHLVRAAEWLLEKTGRPLKVARCSDGAPVGESTESIDVTVVEGSSERMALHDGVVDLVLTDPPYHDDVQYGELSLPLRAWAGLGSDPLTDEAVVNERTGKAGMAYRPLLEAIFRECHRVLRPEGHLVFSYANRMPGAWADLFGALNNAGFRAVGCEIVHSENETDTAKRGVRACTLDLLLDLVPSEFYVVAPSHPASTLSGEEADFLRVVSRWFLRVGELPPEWESELTTELTSTPFLKSAKADMVQNDASSGNPG